MVTLVKENPELCSRSLSRLRALCRETSRLPASCSLPNNITYGRDPISSSAFSDVYRGQLNGRAVALKALRIHVDNRVKVTKVSIFSTTQSYVCS